ncbi:MAG: hypothetical protein NTV33_08175 [Coprothermobacterota bacterium]|nr:hypothetical protein [Coprothermobacterota bacterium]
MAIFPLAQWVRLLQDLSRQGDSILTDASLRALTGLEAEALRKAVWRLTQKGLLVRLGPHLFGNSLRLPTLEALACLLARPAYISRESALSEVGILSQMPLTLTCVTTGKTREARTPLGNIAFSHLQIPLFWGYSVRQGILWAEPEKALLDWVYMARKAGSGPPTLDELEWEALDPRKLKEYEARFPKSVQAEIARWRPQPTTLEDP